MNKPNKTTKRTLLLIDDTAVALKDLYLCLEDYGYDLKTEVNPDRALEKIAALKPAVILLDLHFPGDDKQPAGSLTTGERLLSEIRIHFPELPIVIFSEQLEKDDYLLEGIGAAHRRYSKDQIERMVKDGEDWVGDLAGTLDAAVDDVNTKPEEYEERLGFVVGKTKAMRDAAKRIIGFAPLKGTVLIEGDSGTGKELVANALHRLSGRKGKFGALNCSGLAEEILESRLFGHEKGAFTGAFAKYIGEFQSCDKGTLFLDEIQEMSSSLQNKLMRVLNDGVIRPMGGSGDIHLDTRIIAATNKPAITLMAEGKLRGDLYHRMSVLTISLPPLRERFDDLRELCDYLMSDICKKQGKKTVILRHDVYDKLRKYSWSTGNIRELYNVLYQSVAVAPTNVLFARDIMLPDEVNMGKAPTVVSAANGTGTKVHDNDPDVLSHFMEEVKTLPVSERYDFTKEIPKHMRKDFFSLLAEFLRQQLCKKVENKDIAEYLCGTSDDKTCATVRQFLRTNGFYLRGPVRSTE